MRKALVIIGAFLMFAGSVWFLQGINVLTVGDSPMIGDTQWSYRGAAAVVAGLVLVIVARRRR